jgi:ribokinase
MASYDVVTIGGAVRDIVLVTNQGSIIQTPENLTAQKMVAFEYGAKLVVPVSYKHLGGGAANAAVAFAKLGLRTATVLRVGSDSDGDAVIHALDEQEVATSFVQNDAKQATGFSVILLMDKKERDRVVFCYRGANDYLSMNSRSIPQTKWIYIASLSGAQSLPALRSAFAAAKSRSACVAWNPGQLQIRAGKKILEPMLRRTTVLILNKDEAIELVLTGLKLGRRNPAHLNKPMYLLNILREWCPAVVVITDGSRGAWAYDGNKIYRQKATKHKTVDTTGVGDAFGAAFIAGYIANAGNVQQALQWGIVNSGSTVTKIGAQNGLLSRQQLMSFIHKS